MLQIIGFVAAILVGIWIGSLIVRDNRRNAAGFGESLDRLSTRNKELEARLTELEWETKLIIYLPRQGYGMDSRHFKLREVVEKILDHLGVQLNIEQGTPERMVLQKKPKGK